MIRNAETFVVRARLATPISLDDPVHLEGILFDARFIRDPSAYGTPLECLAMDEGVYRASASILVADGLAGASFATTPVLKRIDTRGLALNRIDVRKEVQTAERTIGPMSPLRPSLVRNTLITGVSEVMWVGLGDAEGVWRLLRDVPSIGKLRKRGLGAVDEWNVDVCDVSPEDAGWFAQGRILRRLPTELVRRRLGAVPELDVLVRHDTLEPPYWDPKQKVEVAMPTLRSMIMTGYSASSLLAA